MELYLVRHGQTDWNLNKRLQGGVDIPLNKNGQTSADTAGHLLSSIKLDRIYSSPLQRAYETACRIRGERDIPLLTDDRLREIRFGVDEGRGYTEMENDPNSLFRYFFVRPDLYHPGKDGEELTALIQRAASFLEEVILPLENICDNVLIVGHGAINKALLMYIRNEKQLSKFWGDGLQDNCEIVHASLINGRFGEITITQ